MMKNQGKQKNRGNTSDSLEFIHLTADLIGTFEILER